MTTNWLVTATYATESGNIGRHTGYYTAEAARDLPDMVRAILTADKRRRYAGKLSLSAVPGTPAEGNEQ